MNWRHPVIRNMERDTQTHRFNSLNPYHFSDMDLSRQNPMLVESIAVDKIRHKQYDSRKNRFVRKECI